MAEIEVGRINSPKGRNADWRRAIHERVGREDNSWFIEPRHDCGPVG